MIKTIKRAIVKKFIGNNPLLWNIVYREFANKNYLTAAGLMIYTLPIRKFIRLTDNERYIKFVPDRDYYIELHKLLHVAKVEGFDLVRIGRDYDGGYIMLNDFHDGGIAYSFGICDDVSWDKAMAAKGYDVFMYDHTIEKLPEENSRFHYLKQGISDNNLNTKQLKTLEYFIKQNHHDNKRSMILKMDVEGAEWGFFETVSSEILSQFDQIVLEFHGFHHEKPDARERVLNVLRKINETHQLIHIHGQNVGTYVYLGDKPFCNQIEVSYILRSKYKFSDDYDVSLPLALDMPARYSFPDIALGHWNREIKPEDDLITVLY